MAKSKKAPKAGPKKGESAFILTVVFALLSVVFLGMAIWRYI